jgi:hypothetical protein
LQYQAIQETKNKENVNFLKKKDLFKTKLYVFDGYFAEPIHCDPKGQQTNLIISSIAKQRPSAKSIGQRFQNCSVENSDKHYQRQQAKKTAVYDRKCFQREGFFCFHPANASQNCSCVEKRCPKRQRIRAKERSKTKLIDVPHSESVALRTHKHKKNEQKTNKQTKKQTNTK